MSETSAVNKDVSPWDQQVWAVLDVVGRVSRDPDPTGFGYIYENAASIAEPLGEVSDMLGENHGLTRTAVFDRFLAASELSVLLHQCVEPRLPDNPTMARFN
jgi:hypothetical protein